ncbi:DUF4387 domain-containing protein [Glutamicibacter arilaitensis]|uniref:DUF4387 domain-containing protein n=1 Tax=Glutamicibacter arilaitensis TaxID=256701 RepID=UPI00384C1D53
MTQQQIVEVTHGESRPLGELAKLIRSKNAGPWMMTIDVMLADAATFEMVVRSGALTADKVGTLLGVNPADIDLYEYSPAHTIKISFPRRLPNGHPDDTDIFGGQQFAPLVNLPIPTSNPQIS